MAAADSGQISILVIDNEPLLTDLVANILEPDGFVVHVADGGEKGLEMAARLKPTFILLDLCLPGLDSHEVARRLRENPVTANMPIIYMSARSADEDVRQSFASDGQAILRRPFSIKELKDLVALTLQSIEGLNSGPQAKARSDR